MADGANSAYGGNARKAASMAPSCSAGGCPSCVKTGLPLLLVRAGLVDKHYGDGIASQIKPLLEAVAAPAMASLGYSMRTLREGYLYAYYEKPHTAEIISQNGWQVNLVDGGGYLTPCLLDAVPVVGSADVPAFACQRTAGYASAMLFVIPDATNTTNVWIAFSESPWSLEVLERYAGDKELREKRMTLVDATSAKSEGALVMSEASIENFVFDYYKGDAGQVLAGNPHQRRRASYHQCSVPTEGFASHVAPQTSRQENADDLVKAARQILDIGGGHYNQSQLMIVGVDDAIGTTHEAAVLRKSLFDSAERYALEKANGNAETAQWMLNSAFSIEGLMQSYMDDADKRVDEIAEGDYAKYEGRRMHRSEFDRLIKSGELPAEAVYFPETYEYNFIQHEDESKPGTVHVPTEERVRARAEGEVRNFRRKLRSDSNGSLSSQYVRKVSEHASRDGKGLLQMEVDYFSWMDSSARKCIFENDFHEDCDWQSFFYLRATARVCHAGHLTGGEVQEGEVLQEGDLRAGNGINWYLGYLNDNPEEKQNILLRALLGNRKKNFDEWLEKRENVYGLMGNVLSAIEEEAKLPGASKGLKLGAAAVPFMRVMATGYVSALLPIVGGVAFSGYQLGKISHAGMDKLVGLTSILAGHAGRASNATLVKVSVPLFRALRLWRRMAGGVQTASEQFVRNSPRNGRQVPERVASISGMLRNIGATDAARRFVDVFFWVDKLPQELEAWSQGRYLAAQQTTRRAGRMQRQLSHFLLVAMPGAIQPAWQNSQLRIATNKLSQLADMSAKIAASGNALMAVGSGVLSTLAISRSVKEFQGGNADERAEAAVGILSGTLAFSGAMMSLAEALSQIRGNIPRAEAFKLVAGRLAAGAALIDAVTNFIKAIGAWKKADRLGGGVLFSVSLVLALSGAATLAAASGSTLVILGIGMTGWGLILALIGIGLTFVYYMLKDSPLEEWTARSWWGEASATERYPSLEREQRELDMLRTGVSVEFDHRFISASNTPGGKGFADNIAPWSVLGNVFDDIKDGKVLQRGGNRDAWFRLRYPEALDPLLHISVAVYAIERTDKNTALVGIWNNRGGAAAAYSSYKEMADHTDVVPRTAGHEIKNGIVEATQEIALKIWTYTSPWLRMWVSQLDEDGFVDTSTTLSFEVRPGE